jgi:Amt family ammonium transporter
VCLALAALAAYGLFATLRRFNMLRIDQMTELMGIDNADHGGPAYPEFHMTHLNHGSSARGGLQ